MPSRGAGSLPSPQERERGRAEGLEAHCGLPGMAERRRSEPIFAPNIRSERRFLRVSMGFLAILQLKRVDFGCVGGIPKWPAAPAELPNPFRFNGFARDGSRLLLLLPCSIDIGP